MLFFLISFLFLIIAVKLPGLIISDELIHRSLNENNDIFNRRPPRPKPSLFLEIFFDRSSYQFYLAMTIAVLLKNNQYINAIEKDVLKSEVSYLKAQINPHFLFNTLNSIYALTLVKSDDAPESILKLSSIMRYVVTESSKEKVNLQDEINYINDYITLQKLRLTSNIEIDYKVEGAINYQKIAPLLFIPIIENCFKYGVNQTEKATIIIHLFITSNEITLVTSNRKIAKNISEIEKTETGILNTIKRLDILYLNKYHLSIDDTENVYNVNLKISLK